MNILQGILVSLFCTAALYLQENDLTDAPVRFDVIEVLPGELRHIENAFDATGME